MKTRIYTQSPSFADLKQADKWRLIFANCFVAVVMTAAVFGGLS